MSMPTGAFSQPVQQPRQPTDRNLYAARDINIGKQVLIENKTYQVNPQASFEERLAAAERMLRGGVVTSARELLRDLITSPQSSNKVVYYYLVAVLSGRTVDHLSDDEFRTINGQAQLTKDRPRDEWTEALETVEMMVANSTQQAADESQISIHRILDRFQKLDSKRREEIIRHLDMILSGQLQDLLDAKLAGEISTQRMGDGRRDRVWMFFEPIPLAPQPMPVAPEKSRLDAWIRLGLGLAAVGGGVALALLTAGRQSLGGSALVTLLWLAGGAGIALFGPRHDWMRRRLARSEREFSSYADTLPAGWSAPQPFSSVLERLVSDSFASFRPRERLSDVQWAGLTVGIRATLRRDLTLLYGYPDADVARIRWLVRWYAWRAADQWRRGKLAEFRERLRVPFSVRVGVSSGWTAFHIATVTAVILGMFAIPWHALLAAMLLVTGEWVSWKALLTLQSERIRYAEESRESTARLAAERTEFGRWSQVLADRPSDEEMARWLDYDKVFIRMEVMRDYGLSNRDVITHVLMTQEAPDALRARVLHGPPRYSKYEMILFLLSQRGVRQVAMSMDFATGTLSNESRQTFRYDMIESVRVDEFGLRLSDGQRKLLSPQEAGAFGPHVNKLVTRQAFNLNLAGGREINVLVENFEKGFLGPEENLARLRQLALSSSGISSAIRILESVSADGRDWITDEQRRLRRRLQLDSSGDTAKALPPSSDGDDRDGGPWST